MTTIPAKEVAKQVRSDLKLHFPGTKFKVVCRGSSIDVNWVDGPRRSQVEAKIGHYHSYDYDIHGDMWLPNGEDYGNKYISIYREISYDFMCKMVKHTAKRYGVRAPTVVKSDYSDTGYIRFDDPDNTANEKQMGMPFNHHIEKRSDYYTLDEHGEPVLDDSEGWV